MTPRTLPREPFRGSMICGWQISSGGWSRPMAFCAERKGEDMPLCETHYWEVFAEYGEVHMAPGNALGAPELAVRLLWEPMDGDVPEEASYEDMARYAGVLDLR